MKELHALYKDDNKGSLVYGENSSYIVNVFLRKQRTVFPKKDRYVPSVRNVTRIDGVILDNLEQFFRVNQIGVIKDNVHLK